MGIVKCTMLINLKVFLKFSNMKVSYIVIQINSCYTVVGEKEMTSKTVNVRTRDNIVHGEKTLQQLLDHMTKLKTTRSRDDSGDF